MYDDSTVLIVGHGRTSSDNAITKNFQLFYISFIVDTESDRIIDLQSTTTLQITDRFIRDMFVGRRFDGIDPEIERGIRERYFGSSQKAIEIAYRDALKKYREVKERYY